MRQVSALLLVLLLLSLTALVAQADPPPNAANVLHDLGDCWIAIPGQGVIYSTLDFYVGSNSANGNWQFQCHGTLPDSMTPPDKTLVMTDEPCWALNPLRFGNQSRTVISPSGQVILRCAHTGR